MGNVRHNYIRTKRVVKKSLTGSKQIPILDNTSCKNEGKSGKERDLVFEDTPASGAISFQTPVDGLLFRENQDSKIEPPFWGIQYLFWV